MYPDQYRPMEQVRSNLGQSDSDYEKFGVFFKKIKIKIYAISTIAVYFHDSQASNLFLPGRNLLQCMQKDRQSRIRNERYRFQ